MEVDHTLKTKFLLDPSITFLNFGSFGACPKPIFEDYQRWQLELEREPIQFITVNGPVYLQNSRMALGKFINCHYNDVVYVTNPSYAVNLVAKSIDLQPGDEVLATNLEYGACDKTWDYYCAQKGAIYKRTPITLPIKDKDTFIEEFFKGVSNRTKLIFISHITSSTALIFPVKEICELANKRGILTFVDGAHAPAHVDLDLKDLNADIYTGACHKWMMAPKGCSFLYVKREIQDMLDPLVISWGFNAMFPGESKFIDYHQLQGTRDFSAMLTVPAAIEFMNSHNWRQRSDHCKDLVLQNAPRFYELLNTAPLAPLTKEFIGQMCSFQIKTNEPEKLQRSLFVDHKIEIPVMRHGQNNYIRYSIQVFNKQHDLDHLYDTLKELKDRNIIQ